MISYIIVFVSRALEYNPKKKSKIFMLLEQIQEQLRTLTPEIETITQFWKTAQFEDTYTRLKQESEQESFWQNPQQTQITKELHHLNNQREQYQQILENYRDLSELAPLFEHDPQELQKIAHDLNALRKTILTFKVGLLLSDMQDSSNCFLSINAGAGGTESQDWSEMMLRMYIRFCERNKLTTQIIDYQSGEGAGIKSAVLFITGKNPYGLLKSEQGVHRLVRVSPFDANARRHTSFCAITVTPEVPEVEVTVDPSDLRIDTYRASGAGGQHVNKTESAVRITHLPSGIVVQCQSDRSQIKNKETALKMLKAQLAQKARDEQMAKNAAIEKKKIEWGSQIRSYILHPYKMVKDHRTDIDSPQPDLVLDGDLMPFIEAYLIQLGKTKKL